MACILLVDDDHDIRFLMTCALEGQDGIEVVDVADAREALELLRADPTRYKLVLLDAMLPGMDGPELLTLMRAAPALAAIPVIFVTANAYAGDAKKFIELGALDVITKPLDLLALPDKVRQALATT